MKTAELISIYYGEDTTKEQAEALLEKVEKKHMVTVMYQIRRWRGQAKYLISLFISRIEKMRKSPLDGRGFSLLYPMRI